MTTRKVKTNSSKQTQTAQMNSGFSSLFDHVAEYQITQKPQYISREFQDYGYRLAVALNDIKHKSLYIKMAKKEKRSILEQALSFVSDAQSARSKARLFMWKVSQLKKENNHDSREKKG